MSDDGGGGHGAVWLMSYADMVTLLLAFFVVMYTMSQVDAEKAKVLATSMHEAFTPFFGAEGGVPYSRNISPGSRGLVPGGIVQPPRAAFLSPHAKKTDVRGTSRAERDLTAVMDNVNQLARDLRVDRQLRTKVTARGAVITFEETATSTGGLVPFSSGSAALRPGFKQVLDRIAPILSQHTNKIEVQGHTDRRPIRNTVYPSNWELSAARAGSVVRYFTEVCGLPAAQFVCTGFADTLPVDPRNNEIGWAHCRRIEIVVTRQPSDVYDQMSRADAVRQPTDITSPVGQVIVPTGLPNDQRTAGPRAAEGDTEGSHQAH